MARPGTKRSISEFMLSCYCEATGCSKASVIADCLIDGINEVLRDNAGVRERYEKIRRTRERAPHLRLVRVKKP